MSRPTRPSRRLWLAALPGLLPGPLRRRPRIRCGRRPRPAAALDPRRPPACAPVRAPTRRLGRATARGCAQHRGVAGRPRARRGSAGSSRTPSCRGTCCGSRWSTTSTSATRTASCSQPAKLTVPATFGGPRRAARQGRARHGHADAEGVRAPPRGGLRRPLPAAWQGGYTQRQARPICRRSRGAGPVLDLSPTLSDPAEPRGQLLAHRPPLDAARARSPGRRRWLAAVGAAWGCRSAPTPATYHTVTYPDFYGSLAREVTAGAHPAAGLVRRPPAGPLARPDLQGLGLHQADVRHHRRPRRRPRTPTATWPSGGRLRLPALGTPTRPRTAQCCCSRTPSATPSPPTSPNASRP